MLISSENPRVNGCLPDRLLCSGHLYQNHLEPGTQPWRLDWPLPFSGRHGRKCLVAFVTASKFPVSESERQWPYMVITPVPSSWLHTSQLRRRQNRREGKRGENCQRACFFGALKLLRSWLKTPNHPPFCSKAY